MKKIIATALLSFLTVYTVSANSVVNNYRFDNVENMPIETIEIKNGDLDIKSRDTLVTTESVTFDFGDNLKLINGTAILNMNKVVGNPYQPDEKALDEIHSILRLPTKQFSFGTVYDGWFKEDIFNVLNLTKDKLNIDGTSPKESEFGNISTLEDYVTDSPNRPLKVLGSDVLYKDNANLDDNIRSRLRNYSKEEVKIEDVFANGLTQGEAAFVVYKTLGTERRIYKFMYFPFTYSSNVNQNRTKYVPIGESPFLEKVPDSFTGIRAERFYTLVYSSRSNPSSYRNDIFAENIAPGINSPEFYTFSVNEKEITRGEFIELVWKKLYVQGEELMNEKEVNSIIASMGHTLPVSLKPQELYAAKQLLARGILDESFDFRTDSPISKEDFLSILMRAKDKSSRLDLKKLEYPNYLDLIEKGFYLTKTGLGESPALAMDVASLPGEIPLGESEQQAWIDRVDRAIASSSVRPDVLSYFFKIDEKLNVDIQDYNWTLEDVDLKLKYTAFPARQISDWYVFVDITTGWETFQQAANGFDQQANKNYVLTGQSLKRETDSRDFKIEIKATGGLYRVNSFTGKVEGQKLPEAFPEEFSDLSLIEGEINELGLKKETAGIFSRILAAIFPTRVVRFNSSGSSNNVIRFNVRKEKLSNIHYNDKSLYELTTLRKDSDKWIKDKPGDISDIVVRDRQSINYDTKQQIDLVEVYIKLSPKVTKEKFLSRVVMDTSAVNEVPFFYDDSGIALVDSRWLKKNGFIDTVRKDKKSDVYSLVGYNSNITVDLSDKLNRKMYSGQLIKVFSNTDKSPLIIESYDTPGEYLIDLRIVIGQIGTYFVTQDSKGNAIMIPKSVVSSKKFKQAGDSMKLVMPYSSDGPVTTYIPMYNLGHTDKTRWAFDITYPHLLFNWIVVQREDQLESDHLIVFTPRLRGLKNADEVQYEKDMLAKLGYKIPDKTLEKVAIKTYALTDISGITSKFSKSIQNVDFLGGSYGITYSKKVGAYLLKPQLVSPSVFSITEGNVEKSFTDTDERIANEVKAVKNNLNNTVKNKIWTQAIPLNVAHAIFLAGQSTETKWELFGEAKKDDPEKHALTSRLMQAIPLPVFLAKDGNDYMLINMNINLAKYGERSNFYNPILQSTFEVEQFKNNANESLKSLFYPKQNQRESDSYIYNKFALDDVDKIKSINDRRVRKAIISPQYSILKSYNAINEEATYTKSQLLSTLFYVGSFRTRPDLEDGSEPKKLKSIKVLDKIPTPAPPPVEYDKSSFMTNPRLLVSFSGTNVVVSNDLDSVTNNELGVDIVPGREKEVEKFKDSLFQGLFNLLGKQNLESMLGKIDDGIFVSQLTITYVLPRVIMAMFFIFMILTLVANNKMVQLFAAKAVDPFKIISLGLTSIEEVNTKKAWITTFFGMVLLYMFSTTFIQMVKWMLSTVYYLLTGDR